MAAKLTAIGRDVMGAIKEVNISAHEQMDGIDSTVGRVASMVEALEAKVAGNCVLLQRLRSELAVAEAAPAAAAGEVSDFSRVIDSALLRVSAGDTVSLVALSACVRAVLSDAGVAECNAIIEGPDIGKCVEVRFQGSGGAAQRRLHKTLDIYWRAGAARDVMCDIPGGGKTRCIFDRDKNRQQTRTEILTWKLQLLLESSYRDLAFRGRRRDGIVSLPQGPLCRVVVTAGSSRLEWNQGVGAPAGIDRDDVSRKFEEAVADPMSTVQWG